MSKTNKSDALDAKGLAILLHNGTLPESWIAPSQLRDRREMLRTPMALRNLRSSLKHRIHVPIDRYGLQATCVSELFGVKERIYIAAVLDRLPLRHGGDHSGAAYLTRPTRSTDRRD